MEGHGQVDKAQAEERRRRFNQLRYKLECIYREARRRGDLTNAVRVVHELRQIAQLEPDDGDLEEQRTWVGALPRGALLTDEDRKYLEEIKNISPANRMLMCEGFRAVTRISELQARTQRKSMSDLLHEQPKNEE